MMRELEKDGNRHGARVRWANYYTVCSGKSNEAGDTAQKESRMRKTLIRKMDDLRLRKRSRPRVGRADLFPKQLAANPHPATPEVIVNAPTEIDSGSSVPIHIVKNDSNQKSTRNIKRFCNIPSSIAKSEKQEDSIHPDLCWVKVNMGEVDEVAAHCGLFRPSWPHYHEFLIDVCEKMASWVEEEVEKQAEVKHSSGKIR